MFCDFQKRAGILALSTCLGFGFSCNCSTNAMFPHGSTGTNNLNGTVNIGNIMSIMAACTMAAPYVYLESKKQEVVGAYLVNNKITMIRIVNDKNSLSYELYSNNKKVKYLNISKIEQEKKIEKEIEKEIERTKTFFSNINNLKDGIVNEINNLKDNIDDVLFDCINLASKACCSDLFSDSEYNFDYIELTLGISLCAGTGDAKRVLRCKIVCKDTNKTDDVPEMYFNVCPELDLLRKKLCYRDFRSLF